MPHSEFRQDWASFALRTQDDADVSAVQLAVTSSTPPVCTSVCTSESEKGNGYAKTGSNPSHFDLLVAALLTLSSEDRARLAALLISGNQAKLQ